MSADINRSIANAIIKSQYSKSELSSCLVEKVIDFFPNEG